MGVSRNTIQRYICLTKLLPELLDMTDSEDIKLSVAVEISFLSRKEQSELLSYIENNPDMLKKLSVEFIKEICESGTDCLSGSESATTEKAKEIKLTLKSGMLKKYFPPSFDKEAMQEVIGQLLGEWNCE